MSRIPLALSHGGPIDLTADDPQTLPELLRLAAVRFPSAALVTLDRQGEAHTVRYPELLDTAGRLLTGLRRHGLAPGDRAILVGLPPADFFPALWACLLGGVQPMAISEPVESAELHAGTGRFVHAWRRLGRPPVLSSATGVAALTGAGVPAIDPGSLTDRHGTDPHRPDGADTALLMLSSGSTGHAKAARLTHRGLAEFGHGSRRLLGWRPGEVALNWLPTDHSGALLLYHLLPLFTGTTQIHVPTDLVLADPLRWLDLMDRHRVNHSWAPAFGYQLVRDALARRPEADPDLSAVRTLVSGGEQITPGLVRGFLAATARLGLPGDSFVPAWGMAETCTGITMGRFGAPGGTHRIRRASLAGALEYAGPQTPDDECVEFVSVGRPAPGTTLRIVGPQGEVLPEGRIGTLQVGSARVTPGYVDDPAADERAFPTGDWEPRSWLDTGDLGFLRNGELVVTGRDKDIVILNGHNHLCHEIEEVAASVEGVLAGAVAACGLPGAGSGTEALGVLFAPDDPAPDDPAREAATTARAIRAALFTRLRLTAAAVVPVAAAAFPRTSSGKVLRRAAREILLASGPDEPRAPAQPPLASQPPLPPQPRPALDTVRRAVREVLAARSGGAPDEGPGDTTPFHELGLDSVALVRLHVGLERALAVGFPRTLLFEHPTIASLAAALDGLHAAPEAATGTTAGTAAGTARTAAPADAPEAPDRRVAVIGMALRFPGASDPEGFWADLRAGTRRISTFSEAELASAGLTPEDAADPRLRPFGGVLDDVTGFDHRFFGVSPHEAALTHPAHRLFLECAYHALEEGGYADPARAERIGVFAGSGMNLLDYQGDAGRPPADPGLAMQSSLGAAPDFLASRVAYRLNLRGPAIGVQTACSSSLVAVHLAVQALQNGDAELALAGAAAVHLPQHSGYRLHPGSVLSPSGACRPFDAAADGTVGGNGVAVVLLKPLRRALADGDRIHAVIAGSAVNNDGAAKIGFTAPGVTGQTEVISQALARAGLPADGIGHLEAHGTGTPLGDPVEFAALSAALRSPSGRTGFCTLGSVKANIGHLDTCAGMAGLIKSVLMLRHRTLVAMPGPTTWNPALDAAGSPFVLATDTRPWPAGHEPRRAGVSALGVGGTNAFVVLEEAPEAVEPAGAPAAGPAVLALSAGHPEALRDLASELSGWLAARPRTPPGAVAAELARRPRYTHRLAVTGRTATGLAEALDTWQRTGATPDGHHGSVPPEGFGPTAFAYSGQGSDPRPLLALLRTHPASGHLLAECDEEYRRLTGTRLLDRLEAAPDGPLSTELAQPALFAAQAAATELWRGRGLRPDHLLGHSIGEYAALWAAGGIGTRTGLRLTALRGRLMQGTEPGAMLAVRADPALAGRIAAATGLTVAAENAADSQVLSGRPGDVDRAAALLDAEAVAWRRLPVDRAFHSALLDPVLAEFRREAQRCEYLPIHTPFACGPDGTVLPPGSVLGADHLVAQLRGPVRFRRLLTALEAAGCRGYLTIGPDEELAGLGRRTTRGRPWTASQRRALPAESGDALAQAELYCLGAPLGLPREGAPSPDPLPRYPFRRTDVPYSRGPSSPEQLPPEQLPPEQLPTEPLPTEPLPPEQLPTEPARPDARAAASGVPLAEVIALTSRHLGCAPGEVAPDDTFVRLGADSLALAAMGRELRERFGSRVALRDLFDSLDTPRRLAAALEPHRPAAAAAAPAVGAAAAPAPVPAVGAAAVPAVGSAQSDPVQALIAQQLRLNDRMADLIERQLAVLGAGPAPSPAPPAPPTPVTLQSPSPAPSPSPASAPSPAPGPSVRGCDFSLYFFGDYPEQDGRHKYDLVLDATAYADRQGFHTVWLPERHFHSFGALFPNPSVLAAALATRTTRIRLHAGSVVLPLHHPIRVAEEWSVVDNLSDGRAGLCVASGWHARDFALAPEGFGRHRELMYERLDTVRALWSGASVGATAGDGRPVDVALFPRPVQAEPPLFVAVAQNPDSYRAAARNGLGVVTNLMSQSVEQLAENIAIYRGARAEAGLDPAAGRVVALLHTYLGTDRADARAEARDPFCAYLRSSMALLGQFANSLGLAADLERTPPEDLDFLLQRAYEQYCADRALIGTVDSAAPVVARLLAAGVDEIAGFVDFGLSRERVLDGLVRLDELRRRFTAAATEPEAVAVAEPEAETEPEAELPLSPAQRGVWFIEQLDPDSTDYLEPRAIRLDGPLDQAALDSALDLVVRRQPALRTAFRQRDGEPRQVVQARAVLDCPLVDCSGRFEEDAVAEHLAELGAEPLDLTRAPLVRARLLRLSAHRHVLVLLTHHLVFDAASLHILGQDLAAHLRAWPHPSAPLPALPARRPESRPESEPTAPDRLAYWRRRLADAPAPALPTDRPRSEHPPVPAWLSHTFGPATRQALRGFARASGATPFMAVVAAVGTVLARFGGQDDLVLGTAVGNRPADCDGVIGFFVETVPLRLDLAGDPAFAELLDRVRTLSADAYDHAVPFDELVRAVNPERGAGRNPLFQVMVEYEAPAEPGFGAGALRGEVVDLPNGRAPFDLSLCLSYRDGLLHCLAHYDAALFTEETVRRILAYVEQVLELGAEDPVGRRLSDLTAPPAAEARLLDGFENHPDAAAPGGPDHPELLHHAFERQARRTPSAPAVVDAGQPVGYRELDLAAEALAARLRTGAGADVTGAVVAVCLPRGVPAVSAVLAVLKAGAVLLPLDPAQPAARLAHMLTDSGAVLLVTTAAAEPAGLRTAVPGLRVLDLDAEPARPAPPTPDTAPARGPDDPALCLYTSGSTGRAKGVLLPHRGPVNLFRWFRRTRPRLRTLQWASAGFDLSLFEVFTTLGSGAALVLLPEEDRYDAHATADAVRGNGVQRLCLTASALAHLMEADPALPELRELVSVGERLLPTPALRRFLAAHPHCALFNEYGPTEASMMVTSHRVDPRDDAPAVGRPVSGVAVRLLDGAGRRVPLGAVGEIHAGGAAPALGYLDRPGETAAAFVPDPLAPGSRLYRTGDLGRWTAAGELRYLGRRDDQVKIRGVRIEPAETRRALLAVPGVRDAEVVVRTGPDGGPRLVGYLVLGPGTDPAEVHARLAARLPGPFVPGAWVRLDRLPLNAAGKHDLAALPEPDWAAAEGGAEPLTPAEHAVHAVWCEQLGLGSVPVDRSFFAVGGHSLSAVRLLGRLRAELGLDCSLSGFLQQPTVRALAGRLPAPGEEGAELSGVQLRMWRRHRTHPRPEVCNASVRLDLTGELDPQALADALGLLAERHEALRSRFTETAEGPRRHVPAEARPEVRVEEVDPQQVDAWSRGLADRPFLPDEAPWWRAGLARLGEGSWTLVLTFHHLLVDGWSLGVLLAELPALYTAAGTGTEPDLPEPSVPYRDYAAWRTRQTSGAARAELEGFWRAELAGDPAGARLPRDLPRPARPSGRGAVAATVLPAAATERLRRLAAEQGSTLAAVLATVCARWLGGLCDQSDLVLALSSANRPDPAHFHTVGMLGGPVPLRLSADPHTPFDAALARTTRTLFTALEHQALAWDEVVAVIPPPKEGEPPLDAVMLTVADTTGPSVRLPGLRTELRTLPSAGVSRTDLYIRAEPGPDGIRLWFEYSTDLFRPDTLSGWAAEFTSALERTADATG
ncbi:MupA/Atu3671 family FMN-dependent luciferase-like monooxygenase [Kitasatospora sp. NPDC048239]|uniref:MupA/Atu3671 family FMN-dependent luciferase-like monooxygenase n=1 Tax=Kitasatospora sp. NPDC048239 TaxID=3364046 RepID=UPI00371BA9A2